jgi:hypothetical protein
MLPRLAPGGGSDSACTIDTTTTCVDPAARYRKAARVLTEERSSHRGVADLGRSARCPPAAEAARWSQRTPRAASLLAQCPSGHHVQRGSWSPSTPRRRAPPCPRRSTSRKFTMSRRRAPACSRQQRCHQTPAGPSGSRRPSPARRFTVEVDQLGAQVHHAGVVHPARRTPPMRSLRGKHHGAGIASASRTGPAASTGALLPAAAQRVGSPVQADARPRPPCMPLAAPAPARARGPGRGPRREPSATLPFKGWHAGSMRGSGPLYVKTAPPPISASTPRALHPSPGPCAQVILEVQVRLSSAWAVSPLERSRGGVRLSSASTGTSDLAGVVVRHWWSLPFGCRFLGNPLCVSAVSRQTKGEASLDRCASRVGRGTDGRVGARRTIGAGRLRRLLRDSSWTRKLRGHQIEMGRRRRWGRTNAALGKLHAPRLVQGSRSSPGMRAMPSYLLAPPRGRPARQRSRSCRCRKRTGAGRTQRAGQVVISQGLADALLQQRETARAARGLLAMPPPDVGGLSGSAFRRAAESRNKSVTMSCAHLQHDRAPACPLARSIGHGPAEDRPLVSAAIRPEHIQSSLGRRTRNLATAILHRAMPK